MATTGTAHDVAVASGNAYLAVFWAGLAAIDITNPEELGEPTYHDTPGWALGVAVQEPLACVADHLSGLQIVDISDLSQPAVGSLLTPDAALDVALEGPLSGGTLAYVAANEAGLRVVDLSTPEAPQEVGYYTTPWRAPAVALDGPYTYLADAWGGLVILRYAPLCPDALSAVTIEGPTEGTTGWPCQFHVAVEPLAATRPITYTWEPEPDEGQGGLDISYSWPVSGTYPITVTADHCGGTVTGTLSITIAEPWRVLLPVVLKGY